MTVVTNFTADITLGESPLTVTFFDLTTGDIDSWLWSFGDGTFSSEQNPVHIFVGVEGQKFDVSLKAWKNDSIVNHAVSIVSSQIKAGFSRDTNALAFASFVIGAGTGGGWIAESNTPNAFIRLLVSPPSENFFYSAIRSNLSVTLPSSPSGLGPSVFLMEANNAPAFVIINHSGNIVSSIGGNLAASSDISKWFAFVDVTSSLGQTIGYRIEPVETLIPEHPPELFVFSGINGLTRVREFTTLSSDDFDEDLKPEFVEIGKPCVKLGWMMLSFVVSARAGGGFSLIVTTDNRARLVANYSLKEPVKEKTWAIKYGMKYRCNPEFDISGWLSLEQDEPGETLIHTFDMSLFPVSESLSVVMSGFQCGELSASLGPLMLIDTTIL